MKYEIQPLFNVKAHHGEGPVWDPVHQQFYWVDIMQELFFIADWQSGVVETHSVRQPIGALALRKDGGLVMALRDGFFFYDSHRRTLDLIDPTEKEVTETRFNDGAVDFKGRFWAGTMAYDGQKPIGNLYALDQDRSVTKMERELMIPNGMGWSLDLETYFFTDTERHVIYAYDYDLQTGWIGNRQPHISFDDNGFPDGLTIDAEGGFWVSMWGAGKISRFDQAGTWVEDIAVPVSHPTSCCFGGPEMKHLLITTSQRPLSPEQKAAEPLAGRCLMIETDVQGRVQPKFGG